MNDLTHNAINAAHRTSMITWHKNATGRASPPLDDAPTSALITITSDPISPSAPTIAATCIACLRCFGFSATNPSRRRMIPKYAGISAVGATAPVPTNEPMPKMTSRTPKMIASLAK